MEVQEIITTLSTICSGGHQPSQVWSDFLEVTYHTLRMVPKHASAVAKTRWFADDDKDGKATWRKLRKRYRASDWAAFKAAFHILLNAAERNHYQDILGEAYMAWCEGNKYVGQYFTPWSISSMMARLTAGDLADDVCKRIEAATGLGMMFELRADRPHLSKWVAEKFLHGEALKRFEPVTVYDCCCGSGTMLLAVAEIMPQWMINYNLVQFYGQDIDYHCVLMARINFMLFGLNGYAGKMAIAAYELANAVGRGS